MVKKLTLSLSKSNTSKIKRKLTRDQIEKETKEINSSKKEKKTKKNGQSRSNKRRKVSKKEKEVKEQEEEEEEEEEEEKEKNKIEDSEDEEIDIEGLDSTDEEALFYDSHKSINNSISYSPITEETHHSAQTNEILIISDESDNDISVDLESSPSLTLSIEEESNEETKEIKEKEKEKEKKMKKKNNNRNNISNNLSPTKKTKRNSATQSKNKNTTKVKGEVVENDSMRKDNETDTDNDETFINIESESSSDSGEEFNSHEFLPENDSKMNRSAVTKNENQTDTKGTVEKKKRKSPMPSKKSTKKIKTGVKNELTEEEIPQKINQENYEKIQKSVKSIKTRSSSKKATIAIKGKGSVQKEEEEEEENETKEKENENEPLEEEETKPKLRKSARIAKRMENQTNETNFKFEKEKEKEKAVNQTKKNQKSKKDKKIRKDTEKEDNEKETKVIIEIESPKHPTNKFAGEEQAVNTNTSKNKNKKKGQGRGKEKEKGKELNEKELNEKELDERESDERESDKKELNEKESDEKKNEDRETEVKEEEVEDGFEEMDFEEIEFEENFQWETTKEEEEEQTGRKRRRHDLVSETPTLEEEESTIELTEISQSTLTEPELIKDPTKKNRDNDNGPSDAVKDVSNPKHSIENDPEESHEDERKVNIEVEIEGDTSQETSKKDQDRIKKEAKPGKEVNKPMDEFSLMKSLTVEDNFSDESEEEEEEEEWESVEISPQNIPIPKGKVNESKKHKLSSSEDLLQSNQSITITFDKDEIKKKKNKGINKFDRIVRELTHKVNLLCLLGACKAWNNWSNANSIKCLSLSVLPENIIKIIENNHLFKLDDFYSSLKKFCDWFRTFTSLDQGMEEDGEVSTSTTTSKKSNKTTNSTKSKSKSNSSSRSNSRSRVKSNTSEDSSTRKKSKSTKKSSKGKEKVEEEKETEMATEDNNDIKEEENKEKFLIRNSRELELLFQDPRFAERFVNESNLYIIMFVALARTAGYRCNFVASLHPIPLSFAKKKTTNNEAVELWTEIYCAKAKRWIPVNPLNKHSVYPIPKQLITNKFNEICYVITIDYDGFIKERTKRYAKDFLTYTRKLRLKNNAKWWEVNVIKRYFSTNVVDESDEEIPDENEEKQPLPTSISGFLNHPLYVLERHIKKYEVLYSKEPVLGYIRNEAIYPRSNVRAVNTKEYWIRQGLSIKEGAEPAKYVKSKVYTIRKKRAIEFSKQNAALGKDFNLGDEMVPLYGDWQTEPYKSPPVKDGIVPKSQFGNIDMFKPSMLPEGGTHLRIQGLGSLARKLNIDFANAVIGFDFRLGHCVPIIDGIVVATENVDLLLSKFEEFEIEKFKKFLEKREKRILSNWRRLVKGLLTRERLMEKYGKKKEEEDEEEEETDNMTE